MDTEAISIKGFREGLLITVSEADTWQEAEGYLITQIEEQGDFFRGAQVALQVGERTLAKEDIQKLRDRLAKHDVKMWAMLGKDPETIRSARRVGLETDLDDPGEVDILEPETETLSDGELPPIDENEYGSGGVLVKNTLRSGRTVRHVGHIVVIGDVNPGAQIVAGGDVLVWGRLRGTVHAGANGDESAIVCALDMRPMQLRIASHVVIASSKKARPHPELAFVKDGQIIAEEWG